MSSTRNPLALPISETTPDIDLARAAPFARGHTSRLPLGHRCVIAGDNATLSLTPATGFVSTASDLARFYAQLSPGAASSILSLESRQEMTQPHRPDREAPVPGAYGLGVLRGNVGSWAHFGHLGRFQGSITRVVVPEVDLTIVEAAASSRVVVMVCHFGYAGRSVSRKSLMSKPPKQFLSPKTLMPPAGYSHIAKVNRGTIVYIAGQVSSDASGKLIGEGDFEAQAEQVFLNLKVAVEEAGGIMADIVKLNIFLVAEVDQAAVPKLRAIRDRYVNVENPPASTLVVVSRLARPGWLIEIEAVAALDE